MGDDHDFVPTSERVTVDAYTRTRGEYLVYCFHVATYEFARPYAEGRAVLDFGCGTGYGTHRLAPSCRSIVGVDVAPDAIRYARAHYAHEHLSYELIPRVEDAPLPFADGRFDVVLSFQVVEHVADVDAYLREIGRVLAPGGTFVCATPERATRLFRGQRPWNLYHRREYRAAELDALLRAYFPTVETYGMTAGSSLLDLELRRCRRMRLLAYPVTFPGAPEALRRTGLRALKRLQARVRPAPAGAAPPEFGFDHTALRIEPGAAPSTNIVAVATRS